MSITLIIIIITVAASYYAWEKPDIMYKWIMNPYTVQRKNQYERFITSGFIHQDWGHLFFNMFALYIFGSNIERVFSYLFNESGIYIYLILYITAIIVSDIPTYLKYKNNVNYNSLGASGGVSAVIFASIIYFPTNDICIYYVLCMPGFIMGIVYLIYTTYQSKRGADNINHDAHLYGALYGVAFAIISNPGVIITFRDEINNYIHNLI
ncbi:MAG: hypothetical protein RLZZ175_413 [Bacteroidota bacterium]|jgi:membrane associated rhomboid family serine protease